MMRWAYMILYEMPDILFAGHFYKAGRSLSAVRRSMATAAIAVCGKRSAFVYVRCF